MARKNILVSKRITVDGMDIKVKGMAASGNNAGDFEITEAPFGGTAERNYAIDENVPLQIQLVKHGEEKREGDEVESCDPCKMYEINTKKEPRFYVKFKSGVNYHFELSMDNCGWKISQKKPGFIPIQRPFFVPKLSKKWNKWPVRLILLPLELAFKVLVKCPAEVGKLSKMVICALHEEPPDSTSLEVGDDGDG